MGIGGKPFECSVLQEAAVEISGVSASHAFLLAPDSPVNLLGRDLLCKLRAQIFFSVDKIILRLPQNQLPQLCAALTQATEDPILPASPMDLPEQLRREVHASLWGASKTNLGTLRTEPVQITLKPDNIPSSKKLCLASGILSTHSYGWECLFVLHPLSTPPFCLLENLTWIQKENRYIGLCRTCVQ